MYTTDIEKGQSVSSPSYVLFAGGSRVYTNYPMFRTQLLSFIEDSQLVSDEFMIVSGGAQGADSLARAFAKEFDIPFTEVLPNWEKDGKAAGVLRTKEVFSSYKPTHVFLV